MGKWTKLNKIMSWCVMLSSIACTLYMSISLFATAGSYGSYSSYYSSALATVVWLGIFTLVVGLSISIGIFAAWNMLIEWYNNAREIKRNLCGEPAPQAPVQYAAPTQYAAPVQYTAPAPQAQPANWQCLQCGGINEANSAFCYNCGKPRQ